MTYLLVNNQTPEWQYIYDIARNDKTHGLHDNYSNINLDTYEHMVVNVRDNVPVAFHGIYNNGRWPSNVSRFCNRAYIVPDKRGSSEGLRITGDNIKYVLDNYDKWNKDVIFISRGVQYDNPSVSYKKFVKFVKFVSDYTGYQLEFDDKLYQCCNNESKDCYQFCVWYDPKQIRHTLDIKRINIEDYSSLGKDTCV